MFFFTLCLISSTYMTFLVYYYQQKDTVQNQSKIMLYVHFLIQSFMGCQQYGNLFLKDFIRCCGFNNRGVYI